MASNTSSSAVQIPQTHMDWVASLPTAEYERRRRELLCKLNEREHYLRECYPFYGYMIDCLWKPPVKIVFKKK